MGKWEIVRFEKVLTIINGKNQKQVENPDGKYPIYGSGGVMGYADNYICDKNTVVIGRKGTINRPIFVEEPFWNVDTAFGLSPNPSLLLPKFLYYFCTAFDFEQLNTTVTIPSLTKANLLKVQIPLPPLDVQQKITDVLDKASALIELRKAQLDKLDLLVKSQFIEMFGRVDDNPKRFEIRSLDDVCKKITDGKHGGCELEAGSGYYYVGAREIYNGKIHYNTAQEITYRDFEESYRRCNLENGDFVIVNTGATIGKTAIANASLTTKTLLQKSVALIKVKQDKLLPVFLQYCYITNPIMYKVESSSAQPNLLLSNIKNTSIFVPPIDLQNQFAAFIQQVDKSKIALQKSLEKLELNYNSLMQKCFRGDLF